MKKGLILISILTIILAFYSFSIYDNQYTLIKKIESIEIREYPSAIYASYYNNLENNNSQFKVLANYIFGDNNKNEEIGMTSPVHMIQSQKKEMLFLMPKKYNIETLPQPNNAQIKICEVKKRKVAVIRFSGYATSAKIKKMKNQLISILNKYNIKTTNKFEVLVYNPPYKVLNRRNELIVTL